jgi:hypothetical protein
VRTRIKRRIGIWGIALVCAVAALRAGAAENTNVIPTFTFKGTTYTNVRISTLSPVDAVVAYDGGGIRVHWTDLPESLQKQYGYDPAKAAEYLAKKNKKPAAAVSRPVTNEAAAAAIAVTPAPATAIPPATSAPAPVNPTPTPKTPEIAIDPSAQSHRMKVINIVATNIYARCLVSVDGSQQEVLLDRLPPALQQSFDGVYSYEAMLGDYAKKVESDKAKADTENSSIALDASHLKQQLARGAQAEIDLVNAKKEEQDLEAMKGYFKRLREDNQKAANILAVPTGKMFAGAEIWKCMGQAP